MAQDTSGIQAIDSLSANEFQVELNGEIATGIFRVSGIHIRAVDMAVGKLVPQPVLIAKMVQQDPTFPFNQWTRETLANPTSKITRQLAVIAMDEGVETRRWVYKEAWISNIEFSDFDSSSEELIEEKLTIHHSGVEEIWPEQSSA